ncbi:Uncharacterised protein [Klebsiella oxytoca]|nr:Uncharacterised protein [Klebsiella oxytoca]
MKQNTRQKRFQPGWHAHPVDQQEYSDQTESRHQLDEKQKERAEAGIVLGEEDVRDFQQFNFAANPPDLHIDEGKQIGQQQHEQRDQRIRGRTLPWRVP